MKTYSKNFLIMLLIMVSALGCVTINKLFINPNKSIKKNNSKGVTQAQNTSNLHIKKIYPKISKLQISGIFNVELKPGPANVLTIYTDENILQDINTELNTETLTISLNSKIKTLNSTPIRITLEGDNIYSATLDGKIHFVAKQINSQNFNLYAKGENLIYLAGSLNMLNLNLNGKTQINTRELTSQSINLDVRGETSAAIFAEQSLKINATGNNKITYYGNPKDITKTIGHGKTVVTKNLA